MQILGNNIKLKVNNKILIDDISFAINSGDMVAITGPSGCGKTTLLNSLGLIYPIEDGSYTIDEANVIKLSERKKTQFWRDYCSFIYQDYGIIDEETVAYNIRLKKKSDEHVGKLLSKIGLEDKELEQAMVLSGGEKQRVGIARAIYKNAQIIFADEPTASLDGKNEMLVINLLKECAANGSIVIIATHDNNLVKQCNQKIELG